ncbi:MAG: NAD(P)H-dependent glycerol-3-phosphate dehydrogenase [Bacillota bacterium]
MQVAVVGAGGWGTALAAALAGEGATVNLWVRNSELYKTIVLKRINETYLPGVKLPPEVRPTLNLSEALQGKELVLMTVPSHGVRSAAVAIRGYLSQKAIIVCAAKGLEENTYLRMSQVLEQEWGEHFRARIAVLSGPNHAEEVSRGIPTATVVAATNRETALLVQEAITTPFLRVYTNPDPIGVEIGGALKNIIALGAGIVEGLGLGDNTKAALVTRGLVEMTRLGTAMGARARTFAGLSGLGDLYVTCSSVHSRNRAVGLQLGQGKLLGEILANMKMVAEGVTTTRAAWALSKRVGVDMPITGEIYRVLFEGKNPRAAVEALMRRESKAETEDIAF